MKKLMCIAVFGMALGFTSCSEDDVVDFACDTVRDGLRAPVQAAIDAYNEDTSSSTLCDAARDAIETYKSNECGDAHFDQVLAGLPDCSTL
ncbi:hypothetical protein [Aquimarina litoralis]|uniref:hypothetical protein n=1 Tax=Aquimarina litoralis TaxID=584605 RepID=UPI001C58FB8F|nr:hypothetical protein [Aquimarina litoralis]MBW1297580.1 hypothetical protein [Aquimarina litoralis]